jgi:hypothetical protein
VRGGISTKGKQERKMVDLLQTWGFHKKDLYSPLKTREKKITLWDFSARLLKRETRTATMSEKKNAIVPQGTRCFCCPAGEKKTVSGGTRWIF